MRARSRGFTIIELMLAMSFISVLLLAIAMAGIQAGKLYNKGLVLQGVNQAGQDIGSVLRRDFLQANAQMIASYETVSTGRLCLGGYSYLWNLPLEGGGVTGGDRIVDSSGDLINFVRIADSGGGMCQPTSGGAYSNTLPAGSTPTHLLRQGSDDTGLDLAVHLLKAIPVTSPAGSAEALYAVEYIIGTTELSEINTSSHRCGPSGSGERVDDEFCAINNFEMIVRTNGQ